MPQQHTQAFFFFFCFYKNNLSNLHAEMIFRLKNIARKKHPPLTLSVGSAATHVSKVRAFQETGSTLPSALSLFISLPFPHLSLSLCSREPLCLSRRSITSRALRPFSSELLSPLLSPFPLRPPHFFLLFFYPQISQNGRQN